MEDLIFERNPCPMLIYDLDTLKILKANAAFSQNYKYSSGEIQQMGLTIKKIRPACEIPDLLDSLSTLNNGDKRYDEQGTHIHQSKNGTLFHVKITSQSYPWEGKNARLAVLLDVTEEVEAKQDLSKAYKELQHHISNSPLASVKWDPKQRVVEWSKQAENMSGYSEGEVKGQKAINLDLIRNGKANSNIKKIIQSVVNGEDRIQFDTAIAHKSGRRVYIRVYLSTLQDPDGKLQSILTLIEDITDRKISEKKLKESLREKQVLVEEVHHRVKNNLAVVSGLLQMQTMHVDDEKLTMYMQNSQLRIQSMAIVHEMLYKSDTLSEIEFHDYVHKLSDTVTNILDPRRTKNISISIEVHHFVLNVNQAIPCALVLSELITNAFEFAFEGRKEGEIFISVAEEKDSISVEVKDDGIGLPDDFDEKRQKSLGINLMENLCMQLETDMNIESGSWGTRFFFNFEKTDKPGSSSSNRV